MQIVICNWTAGSPNTPFDDNIQGPLCAEKHY